MIRFFFFSSRRRHTRSLRDWSSDVCSSDLRCYQTIEGVTMPCYLRVGHEGPHECYPLRGPADRGPIQWVKEQGPAGHPPGTWTPEMKAKLTEKYAAARDNRTLSDLA